MKKDFSSQLSEGFWYYGSGWCSGSLRRLFLHQHRSFQ